MENQNLAFNVSDTYDMIHEMTHELSGFDEAKRILMEFGSQTPRHEFIPHVVINGVSLIKVLAFDRSCKAVINLLWSLVN